MLGWPAGQTTKRRRCPATDHVCAGTQRRAALPHPQDFGSPSSIDARPHGSASHLPAPCFTVGCIRGGSRADRFILLRGRDQHCRLVGVRWDSFSRPCGASGSLSICGKRSRTAFSFLIKDWAEGESGNPWMREEESRITADTPLRCVWNQTGSALAAKPCSHRVFNVFKDRAALLGARGNGSPYPLAPDLSAATASPLR